MSINFKISVEGNPSSDLEHSMSTVKKIDGDSNEIFIQSMVDSFILFCFRNGFEIDDIKREIKTFEQSIYDYSSESKEDYEENSEEVQRALKEIGEDIDFNESRKDIPKLVNDKEKRKEFLEQIKKNDALLKEVFKVYLEDTLSIE